MVQWTVFLISYWGEQIGQKVSKICDWFVSFFFNVIDFNSTVMKLFDIFSCLSTHSFRAQTFSYPESTAEREDILQGLQGRIEDIKSVSVHASTATIC